MDAAGLRQKAIRGGDNKPLSYLKGRALQEKPLGSRIPEREDPHQHIVATNRQSRAGRLEIIKDHNGIVIG